jgi:hypothetical protein
MNSDLVNRYEELRCQALGEMGRGLGMVLFLREGMKVWMEAWMNSTPSTAERVPASPGTSIPVPQIIRDEAILVLVEMALGVQQEVVNRC